MYIVSQEMQPLTLILWESTKIASPMSIKPLPLTYVHTHLYPLPLLRLALVVASMQDLLE